MIARWLVLLVLAASAVAHAQPVKPMSADAESHLRRGEQLYEAGHYARALEEFDRGLLVEANPLFHYAKAQVYRNQGDCTRAVAEYRAFLAGWATDDESADAARRNIERCPIQPPPAPPPPTAAPPAPPPPAPRVDASEPWYRDRAGGILAAAGVVGIAAGATFLVLGEREIRAANRAGSLDRLEELAADGRRDRTIGVVCAAVGGALITAAVVRYALAGRARRATPVTSAVSLSPDSIVVGWTGRF